MHACMLSCMHRQSCKCDGLRVDKLRGKVLTRLRVIFKTLTLIRLAAGIDEGTATSLTKLQCLVNTLALKLNTWLQGFVTAHTATATATAMTQLDGLVNTLALTLEHVAAGCVCME